MKVLHALNYHRARWGSDIAWAKTIQLSREAGLDVQVFSRDSGDLRQGLHGKARAFFGGIYAPEGIRGFREALTTFRPDVVQTHELYPLISPWILRHCASAGVPVVHTCYDYRMTCPIAMHFVDGRVCHHCSGGREYWAVINNCRGSLAESIGFAARNAVARRFRLFTDNVTQFIVPSEFSRQYLIRDVGIDPAKITLQPCVIELPAAAADPAEGQYVAFAGRFAVEKGSQLLIEAARQTGFPVRMAGNAATHSGVLPGDPIECVATPTREDLMAFYRGARFIVVPSIWQETFGVVAAEAMSHGIPVVAARIGALSDTVVDGVTGLLFEAGDVSSLTEAMCRLWNDTEFCRKLGAAGRRRVKTEFSAKAHVDALLDAYEAALSACSPAPAALSRLSRSAAQS